MPGKVTPRGQGASPARKTDRSAAAKKAAATRKRNKAQKAEAEASTNAETPREPQYYVRNSWGSQVRMDLTPFNEDRRIALEPRGQRGDLARVSRQELQDDNLDWNLVEVLSEEQAREVMAGQSINQQAPHAALDALRNALDQPYEKAPQIMTPYEQQGQVVAELGQGGQTRHLGQTEQINRPAQPQQAPPQQQNIESIVNWGPQQPAQPPVPQTTTQPIGPQQVQVPGSQGHPASVPAAEPQGIQVPPGLPPERVADWIARGMPQVDASQAPRPQSPGQQQQAAEALRDSLRVSVDPTQPGV
jgi:hypothetical protein